MFGWKKKSSAAPSGSGSRRSGRAGEPVIAALLLEGEQFPLAALQQHLSKIRIGNEKPAEFNMDKEQILTFKAAGEIFALALMPAPYPWSDLEGPCATSWMWPKETPASSVKRHRRHLLVTMVGGNGEPIPRRLMLTAVTAAAAQQPGVLGIYWPEATLVHHPRIFIEMAQKITSAEAPPVYLWVDYRLFKNKDGSIGLFTTGLRPLGHMEMEIPSIQMNPGELREWAVNITYYLIENGPVLKDGNTIGVDANHQLRIRHVKSQFGSPDTVMRFGG
jgi:hypothetical protein